METELFKAVTEGEMAKVKELVKLETKDTIDKASVVSLKNFSNVIIGRKIVIE